MLNTVKKSIIAYIFCYFEKLTQVLDICKKRSCLFYLVNDIVCQMRIHICCALFWLRSYCTIPYSSGLSQWDWTKRMIVRCHWSYPCRIWVRTTTRARLGRVTPLGRPRSVYKSIIECRFLSRNGPNDLEGQGQWPPFSISAERFPSWRSRSTTPIFNTNWDYSMIHVWCKFGDPSSNLWRVIVRTR